MIIKELKVCLAEKEQAELELWVKMQSKGHTLKLMKNTQRMSVQSRLVEKKKQE